MFHIHSSDPADCTCNCHANPGEKRLYVVNLQENDLDRRWLFSGASLQGFTNPNGLRCRDCNQYYGYKFGTDQLQPIEGNWTFGPRPDSLLAIPQSEGLHEAAWGIVTVWTMN